MALADGLDPLFETHVLLIKRTVEFVAVLDNIPDKPCRWLIRGNERSKR